MKTEPRFLAENKDDVKIKFLLFLISPFLGFIYSIKRINTKSSFIIFFLFSLCFGMCFTPKKSLTYIDGQHYQEIFLSYRNSSVKKFENNFNKYIHFKTEIKDYYADTLAFFVSRFSDNYHVFFFFASIIFSFFLLKTFKYLTNEEEFNNSYTCFLLCYLFVNISIFNINGLRFWTGYWIAMFALFKIFKDKNYKYILLIAISAFCHGTLLLLLPLLLIAIVTKRFRNIWVILYIASFFISEVAFTAIEYVTDYLPMFMQKLVNSYTSIKFINQATAEGTGFWIVGEFFKHVVSFFFFITMILIIINKQKIIDEKRTENLFTLLLVLMTFSNFFSAIPSLGSRFFMFTYPLVAYIWLLHFKDYKKNYSLFFNLIPIYFFMKIFNESRLYIQTLNIDFFISSPIYLAIKYLL